MNERRIIIPYAPRDVFRPFHDRSERWAAQVVHRRAGKTVANINDMLRRALECEMPRPRYAFISPLLKQAKATAWDYLQFYARPIPGVEFNQAELTASLPNEGKITLYGADNPDALRGIYLDGCVLDEFGDMSPRMLPEIIRPALSDRHGWLSVIGTARGKNQFYDLLNAAKLSEDWFYADIKASQTDILSPEELADNRAMMSRDQYAREYENDFSAAIEGAIYRDQLEEARSSGRICGVPYDPAAPVHTSWDIGVGDPTAIWFWQIVGRELHVIDFYENEGKDTGFYCDILRQRDYRYGDHLLPHDAGSREKVSAKTYDQMMREHGFRATVGARLGYEERINAARLAFPRMWFDAAKCKDGLDALASYQWSFNTRLNEFSDQPLHNFASHPADAFGEGVIGLRERQRPVAAIPKAKLPVYHGGAGAWMS